MSTALAPTDYLDIKLKEVTDSNQKGVGQKKNDANVAQLHGSASIKTLV